MIDAKVQQLIKKSKSNCPYKISNHLGIQVIHEDLGNTLGYYSKTYRLKFIHINEKASEKQQKFICSHELGHAVLHTDSHTPFLKKHTFFSHDKIEVEANIFALKLLFAHDLQHGHITRNEVIYEYGVPEKLFQSVEGKIF